jgi:glycosyltransferase involved in cell wall biosynthesis
MPELAINLYMNFSIIICTYNPDFAIFTRLLNAVVSFTKNNSPAFEVIVVDNNSQIPVSGINEVKHLQRAVTDVTLITEKIPGLTAARIAGIQQAKYDWIIFFDDDNEPNADYLNVAITAIRQYPETGAWGPGTIEVEYTEEHDVWLDTKKHLFQLRKEEKTLFATKKSWQPCYPYGTGLIIKKTIADAYAMKIKSGRYTLSDRRGKSLSSGGDVQLVLTGIQMGYGAGIVAGLALSHLINSLKSNFFYLRKLQYGTASAYVKAYNQVFINEEIAPENVTNYRILKKIYSLYRIHHSKLKRKDFKLLLAQKMGEMNAAVFAKDKDKPFLLKYYERRIHV